MKTHRYFLLALFVILLDQGIKLLVKLNMYIGQEFTILGDFFKFHFAENNGFAFGLTIAELASKIGVHISPEASKLALSLFSIAAVIALGYVLFKFGNHQSPLPFFIALIFGGAVGNIIDRTFYGVIFDEGGKLLHGRVVDMFFFDINAVSYAAPIFNLADASITIGIIVVLAFQGKFLRMHEQAEMVRSEVPPGIDPNSSSPNTAIS
jgi:signal peptidase II